MHHAITASVVAGALAAVPVIEFAATPSGTPGQSAAKHSSSAPVASHATSGVIKSFDATTLVIARPGKNPGEMTFELSPSTHREGTVEVGSSVSVRYRKDGKAYLATAITVQHGKPQVTRQAPSSRKGE